jgi:hypothetical protein
VEFWPRASAPHWTYAVPSALAKITSVAVIELRQYTLAPGQRDVLIDLFEAEFVEPQEHCGIEIVGTFRDLDDDQRFVWIRRFPDMACRAESLDGFYGGPAWGRHRDVANATMLDSDNVLLLRPAWPESAFGPPAPSSSPRNGPGVLQVGIVPLGCPANEFVSARFCDEVAPALSGAGAKIFACLQTEPAVNTFPALPVREGENVLVWCAGLPDEHSARECAPQLERITAAWPEARAASELRLLSPTRRSRLTAASATSFRPINLVHQ